MRVDQKSVKVYEIDAVDYNNTIEFIDKNYPFLKKSLIKLNNDNEDKVKIYLQNKGLCVVDCNTLIKYKDTETIKAKELQKKIDTNLLEQQELKVEDNNYIEEIEKEKLTKIDKSLVIHKMLRAGEDIDENRDVIITNRINKGATVKSSGNITILAQCNGTIICNGEILIIGKVENGIIIFNNITIDNNKLNDTLMKIVYNNAHEIEISTLV